MSLQQAALQALEALIPLANAACPNERECLSDDDYERAAKAVEALEQALPQPDQREPLAWFRLDEKTNEAFLVYFPSLDGKDWRPLYAMPRKPLSEDEIVDIWAAVSMDYDDEINIIELGRAIERAHGITGETK